MQIINNNNDWIELSKAAWITRKNAHILGKTKVGSAVLSLSGKIYTGCNIEQIYRSHDIHAEVNAISNMVAAGEKNFSKILIVAERDFFTPCGSCMDWIMQFAEQEALVGFQKELSGEIHTFTTKELMPYYPR